MEGPQSNLEKQERLKKLKYIKKTLESQLNSLPEKSVYITGLINAGQYFEEFNMTELTQCIYSEAIPKAIVLSIQKALGHISENPEISMSNFFDFQSEYSHEAKKGATFLGNFKFSNENFRLLALKFATTVDVLTEEYGSAIYTFMAMGDIKKSEEMKKLYEYQKTKDEDPDVYIKSHLSEILEGIHRAYSEFIEAVKNTEEFNVDLEQVYKDVLQRVDEELAKPE